MIFSALEGQLNNTHSLFVDDEIIRYALKSRNILKNLRLKSECSLSLNFVSISKHMLHKIVHINYQWSTLHVADTWWRYAWNFVYKCMYQCKNIVCAFKCAFHSDNPDNFGIFHVHFWLCATRSNECMGNRHTAYSPFELSTVLHVHCIQCT